VFLKRIDVIGFKSFADKTVVEFSPGITAVVGPNGSGKSNIADAIRWVLGEQSARNLRGSKMEDVIFAGSESRRSINFCEVSLTLDNADKHLPVVFDEVTVTRRVYRSGESEYMLNKQTCRLKDIHELFMDSGLGRESYSIIGQGKIEEMLSTRPEDRRGPFEDAAGIVKYKFRRREAERKFEETDANLVRVDDILAELQDQAGPLEKEAERATTFNALQTSLTKLDISLLVHDIEQLQGKWSAANDAVQQALAARDAAQAEMVTTEAQAQVQRARLEEISRALETVGRHILASTQEKERVDGHLALLRERLQNAYLSREDRNAQRATVDVEIAEIETLLQTQLERLQVVESALEIQTSHLQVAVNRADPTMRSEIEARIEARNSEIIELHHQAATYRNELKSADESLVVEDRKRDRFDQELERFTVERDAHADTLADAARAIATLDADIEALQAKRLNLSEEYRAKATAEADAATELQKLESTLTSYRSRLELLKDLEEGYDGYALGVKTVLQAADKGRLDGVRGSLAALITVDKEFETAVETALGGAVQNIVVDTESAARAAISMLKQRQAGRATFMPIDVIRGRSLHPHEIVKLKTVPGFIGIASALVQCDGLYQKVVEHLLGNVAIAQDLAAANELARAVDYKVRIVTTEGDVVNPGGVMSGGSHARKGPGLLGRSREKQSLEQALVELEMRLATGRHQQNALRHQMTEMSTTEQETERAIRTRQTELANLTANVREYRAKAQAAEERMNAVIWEAEQLKSDQAARALRRADASLQLQDVESQLAELELALKADRQSLETWDASAATAQEALTALRVEVATLTQERDVLRTSVAEMRSRVVRFAERVRQLDMDAAQTEVLVAQTVEEIARAEADAVLQVGQLADLETNLLELRAQRDVAQVDAEACSGRVRQQQRAVSISEEHLHRAQVMVERLDVELNHALTKMGETHQMSFEWAKQHYPLELAAEDARKETERLRRQMTSLGPVQLGAIEEWQRLSERLTFLSTQRADLFDAKSQLLAVIAEIDEEMSRRFAETFTQIRAEFQVAFRQLFNGGRADLQLTNPDNLLESGIEVTAQPPGKSLQNLNLMSGGERALTAMALLFAILKVRPVPFCVLDEVEAALDEANVSRFAQMVRSFADETQFIVITHRRGTMEEADALYGVTMQESGISSLIGVRLTEDMDMETA